MRNRKERRLAANSGRRVKLDLFAEPSEDLGASKVDDEVGEDLKDTVDLPTSASGHQPVNPLHLLGQYSDDDFDDISDNRHNNSTEERSSDDINGQAEEPPVERRVDIDADEENTADKAYTHRERDSTSSGGNSTQENIDARETNATTSNGLHKDMELFSQMADPGTSEAQVTEDLSSGWKMVLHEESSQYYYWNTETGETSWEVPEIFVPKTEVASMEQIPVTENMESVPADTSISMGVELDNCLADKTVGLVSVSSLTQSTLFGDGADIERDNSESLRDGTANLDQNGHQSNLDDALPSYTTTIEHKAEFDLSNRLLTQGQCLVERLKSLKGSEGDSRPHDWISKYISEAEIRLGDIKALASYGSSILPFWLHSERQLKRLDGLINDEIYQLAKSAVMDEVDETSTSSFDKDNTQESRSESVDNENHEDAVLSAENSQVLISKAVSENVESPAGNSGSGVANEFHVTPLDEILPRPDLSDGEDVDMDVDMDVEDAFPASSMATGSVTGTKSVIPVEQTELPVENLLALQNHFKIIPPPSSQEWAPPLPPDNEQAPPLPPDNEQAPPLPPDNEQAPPPPPDHEHVPPPPLENEQVPQPPVNEVGEPLYSALPPYAETVQSVSYIGPYNISYPDPNFQYYAHAVPGSNFYGHADGSQLEISDASYYGTVPTTYGNNTAVVPNAYYGVGEGTVPPVYVDSNTRSLYMETSIGSHIVGSMDNTAVGIPMKVDASVVGEATRMTYSEVPSASAIIQVPATTSVKTSASAQPTDHVAVSATTKSQSNVSRRKKRTVSAAPSLRSNKKVSSLVDKWKAAKEELNENDEDEPEDAYEYLEKKRKKEIEEWHAKQIASGEAKDNANFQPLGGDWRERVKRKRARAAAREAKEKAPEAPKEQPDLAEVTRSLPSGWQAYWDDSSKQLYYGNALTSATTWTRPEK